MTDLDWRELQETWRGDGLEHRARRHVRDARRAVLLETVFAALSVGFAAVWAVRSGQRWVLVWALTLTVLFAMALAYSIWNRRDALWPSSAAPLDFLAQTELRCARRLEMLRFMAQFGGAEVLISLFFFWMTSSLAIGALALALVCAGGLFWLRGARQAALRELRQLARLRDELKQDP
jgi:hypothetical protein